MPRRSTEALVEPAMLAWARTTAGFSVDEAAHSLQTKPEKITAWEGGQQTPSMSQLRRMATAYKRLLSDFYLPRHPEEDPIPHDFRRLPGEVALQYSRALRYQLRLARQRRALALELASELDTPLAAIAANVRRGGDPENAGTEVRRLLDVTSALQRTWRDPRLSYNGWRRQIERAGVLVFQATGIATAEALGFSLPDRPLPVIAVNRRLRPNGRTFTLLHEFVHVLLEESSICDIEDRVLRPAEEQAVEVFCNAVAAASLVPRDALLAEPLVRNQPARPREWSEDELSALGRNFGVSNEVILRRLLTLGRTTTAFYAARRAFWGSLLDPPAAPDSDTEFRRNMPQEVVSDLGRPFAGLVVDSYLNSYTSLSDVSPLSRFACGTSTALARAAGSEGVMALAQQGYCIDTSSIILWFVEVYPPLIFPGLVTRVEALIGAGRLRSPKAARRNPPRRQLSHLGEGTRDRSVRRGVRRGAAGSSAANGGAP
jgi:Zn-dependent peptidase ImmA (M78 family)